MIHIKKFVVNPFQENTFIIHDDTKECVIIDAGCYCEEERNAIDLYIEENKLQVKILVNTHCHLDHIFGNHYLVNKYEVHIAAHKNEDQMNNGASDYASSFELPSFDVAPISKFVAENDIIKFGDTKLKVLEIFGHSPGGIALLIEDQNAVFVGDILFNGSIGRTDLPGGDYEQLIKGIKNKLMTLDDNIIVYAGHGEETSIKKERENNPFLV